MGENGEWVLMMADEWPAPETLKEEFKHEMLLLSWLEIDAETL